MKDESVVGSKTFQGKSNTGSEEEATEQRMHKSYILIALGACVCVSVRVIINAYSS